MPLGSSVVLIQANNLVLNGFNQGTTQGQHGATIRYLWGLSTTANELIATVANVQAAPEAKALSEGFLTGSVLLNQSFDFLTDRGIRWAKEASAAGKSTESKGLGFFGGIQGGWNRTKTGSHVDVAGGSLLAGLSQGRDIDAGRLTLGGFFEYGYGSYDTYNSFSNAPSIKSKGDVQHFGVGVLGRVDAAFGGYAESSLRVGGVRNNFRGSDLTDAADNSANYTATTPYYGIHLGAGYLRNLNEKVSFDLYAKYFWTRQQGDSLKLSTGDPVKFKDVDSHRLRLGTRFAYAMSETVSPYAGAAFEYEFDGRARASTHGYSIDAPKLKGSTGIGEFGVTMKPSPDLPLSLDLGVQGYVGKRQGVTGSLQAKFEF
jgi:outer membrane autotransporter protein